MLNRFFELIYYAVLILMALVLIGVPTYQHGFIGWCIGVGLIVNIVIAMAVIEEKIKYLVTGEFDLFTRSQR